MSKYPWLLPILFSVYGALMWWREPSVMSAMLFGMFLLLQVHTYVSLRWLFPHIRSTSWFQHATTVMLAIAYLGAGASLASAWWFNIWIAVMFATTVMKYLPILGTEIPMELGRFKLRLNATGAWCSVMTLIGIQLGYVSEMVWLGVGGYALITVFLFWPGMGYSRHVFSRT